MRAQPTALEWVDWDGCAVDSELAMVRRLGRRLGYVVVSPPEESRLGPVELVRVLDVDAVIVPSPGHLHALTVDLLMHLVDVESV
ncbi:putative dehydrogenase [Nocardia transvalensis]|uniref:Putative dehydrogenase n=1 Tax=Nocardia transvalensis TaxID=37333 RepID=A0A7W9PGW2_9NOCA